MTPAATLMELQLRAAKGHPALVAWLKQRAKRKHVEAVAGPATLTALYAVGLASTEERPPSDYGKTAAENTWRPRLPHERAIFYVWQRIREGVGPDAPVIGRTHISGNPNGGEFIKQTRLAAMEAAKTRETLGASGKEEAYALLLRWLGVWDTVFADAQDAAEKRATARAARLSVALDTFQAKQLATVKASMADAPARKRRAPQEAPVAVEGVSPETLRAELRNREGSVLDMGVRVLGPDRFKSYKKTLYSAFLAADGNAEDFDQRLRVNDIEVLSEEGGYSPGARAGERAVVLEYVVHDKWSGADVRTNPARYVYVIELDPHVLAHEKHSLNPHAEPGSTCVYVGQTGLDPKERFAVHKQRGMYASSLVADYGRRLFPKYSGPWSTEEEAEREERTVAERLRKEGFYVFGGH